MTKHDTVADAGYWAAAVGDNTIDRYVGASLTEYAGGNAYNVAIQLRLAGIESRYFGAVGVDSEAAVILGGLHRNRLDLSTTVTLPGDTAVTTIRLTEAGDRVFEREDFGVTAEYFPDEQAITQLATADWVHIGMLPRANELRHRLKQLSTRVIISQDCAVSEGITDLDVGFYSAGEQVDARALAAEVVSAGLPLAIVTRGALGAIAFDGTTWWQQDAVPTDALDTTGAGDSFIAGFATGRLRGEDVQSALRTGAERAAITCQHVTGWPHPLEPLTSGAQ